MVITGVYQPRSVEIEAIQSHHLMPRPNEILHEFRLRIVATVDIRDRPESVI